MSGLRDRLLKLASDPPWVANADVWGQFPTDGKYNQLPVVGHAAGSAGSQQP